MREAIREIDAEMKRKSKWNEIIAYSFVAVWTEHFSVVIFHAALFFCNFPFSAITYTLPQQSFSFHNLI